MKKSLIGILHIGYWLCYCLLLTVILALIVKRLEVPHIGQSRLVVLLLLFAIVPALISFYGSYVFLIRFLKEKKYKGLITGILILSLISLSITSLGILAFFGKTWLLGKEPQTFFEIQIMLTVLTLIHGTLGLILRGFIVWFDDLKWKEALMQKNFETELALIKSQIDPHFLFNTLNNIDVLIEKDAKKASLFLNKLSEIMRFMLYETKTNKIPLEKELTYIEKYIDLQKIRTANPDFVYFDKIGTPDNHTIAPMIFIPFIENAFKHAASIKKGNAIDIKIRITKDSIFFTCKNTIKNAQPGQNTEGGIGNYLIKKRLDLLYPNSHTLDIFKNEEVYEVNLVIRSYLSYSFGHK